MSIKHQTELTYLIYGMLSFIFGSMCIYLIFKRNQTEKGDNQLNHWDIGLTLIQICAIIMSSSLLFSIGNHYPKYCIIICYTLLLSAGGFALGQLHHSKWAKINPWDSEKDSFILEFTYIMCFGCVLGWIMNLILIKTNFLIWEANLVFILPFLLIKLTHFVCQNSLLGITWQSPALLLPVVEPDNELKLLKIEIAPSADTEFRIFYNHFIHYQKSVSLNARLCDGFVNCVLAYETRIGAVPDIRDTPLRFRVRRIWSWKYRSTWKSCPRVLDPAATIRENNLQNDEIVRVERMPQARTQ
jgi:hypothetical protein